LTGGSEKLVERRPLHLATRRVGLPCVAEDVAKERIFVAVAVYDGQDGYERLDLVDGRLLADLTVERELRLDGHERELGGMTLSFQVARKAGPLFFNSQIEGV